MNGQLLLRRMDWKWVEQWVQAHLYICNMKTVTFRYRTLCWSWELEQSSSHPLSFLEVIGARVMGSARYSDDWTNPIGSRVFVFFLQRVGEKGITVRSLRKLTSRSQWRSARFKIPLSFAESGVGGGPRHVDHLGVNRSSNSLTCDLIWISYAGAGCISCWFPRLWFRSYWSSGTSRHRGFNSIAELNWIRDVFQSILSLSWRIIR